MVKKGYNKIEMEDGTVLMDFTDTTATTGDVFEGKTFYDKDGNLAEGTYPAMPSTRITTKAPTSVGGIYTPPLGTDGYRRWDIDVTKSEMDKVIDEDESKIIFYIGVLNLDTIVNDIEPGDFWYGNYLDSESYRVKYFTKDGEYHTVTDLVNPKLDLRIEKIYTFSPIGVTSTEHSFSDAEWTKILRSESLLITTQNITDGPITNMNNGTEFDSWAFCDCKYGTASKKTKNFVEFNSDRTKAAFTTNNLTVDVDLPNKKAIYTKRTSYIPTSPTMYIYGIMPYHETYGKWF